jgi:hypothetical protein
MHEYFADSTADLQTVAAELKNQKRKHDAMCTSVPIGMANMTPGPGGTFA